MIAFDTETGLIKPGCLTPPLVCLQLAGDGPPPPTALGHGVLRWEGPHWAAVYDYAHAEAAMVWALSQGQVIATHNGAYDVGILLNEFPNLAKAVVSHAEEDLWWDTMVAEMLIDIAGPGEISQKKGRYSLAGLVDQYLNEHVAGKETIEGVDPWRLRYLELALVPIKEWPQEAVDYALLDPLYTLRVAKAQPFVENVTAQVRASIGLHLCATVGPRTNPERVKAFEETAKVGVERAAEVGRQAGIIRTETEKNKEAIQGALLEAYGGNPPRGKNGNILTTAKSLRGAGGDLAKWADGDTAIAFQKGWLREKEVQTRSVLQEITLKAYGARGQHPGFTDAGSICTDKDTLLKSGSPILKAYAEGSVHRTSLNRYAPQLWLGVDRDMTSKPRPLVATGRCSWTEPNMHNPPREGGFRECFEPRPGYIYGMCDWAAAELRSWSQICIWLFGHSEMAEAFRRGMDPHTMLAATLRKVSYEEALALKKAGDLPERKLAKAGNFGFLGGMGAPTFVEYCQASDLDLHEDEAYRIKEAFLTTWPEARRYFAWVNDTVLRDLGGVGTQFVSRRKRGNLGYCDGCNTFFQGLTADYAKAALWAAWKESLLGVHWEHGTPSPLKGVRIWLMLHDELIVEGPIETSHLWGDRLRELMVEIASMYTPDVPQKADVALSYVWSKEAEETRDSSGKLIPWKKEER